MPSYPIIRRATDEDYQKTDRAARKFAKRHNIPLIDNPAAPHATEQVEAELYGRMTATKWTPEYRQHSQKYQQWLRVFRRALGEPEAHSFGWGNILGKPLD